MFELLQKYFFTGVTGNTAYSILQKFWQQLFGKELEELYLDAFEQAVANQRPHLSKYGDSNNLHREALRRALRANVALELGQTSLSDLSEDKFVHRLAKTIHNREVLTIGGHNLSLEDYQQLLRNLIRQANRTLRQKVLENELAFDQVLLAEVQDNHQQMEQVQTYLNTRFNLVLNQLVSIKADTSLLPEARAKLQEVADEVQALRSNQLVQNTTRVQIYLQGSFSSLTPDHQSSIIDALAGLLKTQAEMIEVYRVYEGSIVFDLGIPQPVAQRLRILLQTDSSQLRLLKIEKVIIENSGNAEKWVAKDNKFNLATPNHTKSQGTEPAATLPATTKESQTTPDKVYNVNIQYATGLAIGDGATVIQKSAGAELTKLEEVTKSVTMPWPANVPKERYYSLPSRERDLEDLLNTLQDPQGAPAVTIDGLGGLGKTAMAVELARRALQRGLFDGVVGDSAKQDLFAGGDIVQVREATLDFDQLLDTIARQLGRWEIPTMQADQKRAALTHLLRQQRYLILVDNLETAQNANSLVAHLRNFLDGSRAIITSRQKIQHDFTRPLSLHGLELEDAIFFLRADAGQRQIEQILIASEEKLSEIHQITGGAPLAMKLVVAQARFLDLELILRQLRQAGGNLYPYIFRQSWKQLSTVSQRVLIYVGRTVVTTVSWEEMAAVEIAQDEQTLLTAIEELTTYSLLEASLVAEQTRYGIHQLTRQFVNSDLPKMWQEQRLQ